MSLRTYRFTLVAQIEATDDPAARAAVHTLLEGRAQGAWSAKLQQVYPEQAPRPVPVSIAGFSLTSLEKAGSGQCPARKGASACSRPRGDHQEHHDLITGETWA